MSASASGFEAAQAEAERLRVALEWFASDEAWTVTPQSQTDSRFLFTGPPGCVYATPWGFAKDVLKSRPGGQSEIEEGLETEMDSVSEGLAWLWRKMTRTVKSVRP